MIDIKEGEFICWCGYAKVRVMAIRGNYFMLRRPGCAPFVRSLRNLKEVNAKKYKP